MLFLLSGRISPVKSSEYSLLILIRNSRTIILYIKLKIFFIFFYSHFHPATDRHIACPVIQKDFQYLTDSGTVTLTDRKRLLWQNYFQGNLFPMQNRLVFLICIQKQGIKLTICLHNTPGFIVSICKRKHIPDKPGHPVSLTFYGFQKSAGIFPVRFHCLYT